MSYRNFTKEIEALARRWRDTVLTDDEWQLKTDIKDPGTAAKPIWVCTKSIVGVAKPGHSDVPTTEHPFAAYEKIAADLAYDLKLPIPPVVLWDRGDVPDGQQQYAAISAVPFPNTRQWGEVRDDPHFGPLIRNRMSRAASAMCVFDTWVQNQDHNNHTGNLLVSFDFDTSPHLRLAYIDYAYALAYAWSSQGWKNTTCIPLYHPEIKPKFEVMRVVIEQIGKMPTSVIREVVERTPEGFCPRGHKGTITDGLLDRRSRLTEIVRTKYSEL